MRRRQHTFEARPARSLRIIVTAECFQHADSGVFPCNIRYCSSMVRRLKHLPCLIQPAGRQQSLSDIRRNSRNVPLLLVILCHERINIALRVRDVPQQPSNDEVAQSRSRILRMGRARGFDVDRSPAFGRLCFHRLPRIARAHAASNVPIPPRQVSAAKRESDHQIRQNYPAPTGRTPLPQAPSDQAWRRPQCRPDRPRLREKSLRPLRGCHRYAGIQSRRCRETATSDRGLPRASSSRPGPRSRGVAPADRQSALFCSANPRNCVNARSLPGVCGFPWRGPQDSPRR